MSTSPVPRILLIEDEPSIADTITYSLETEGFQCQWRATAAEALTALADSPPQLIILDIGLPDINGFELCKRIRQTHETPIIFLTARSDEIDRVVGLEIGGDDYMVKPFSPRELAARVKAILRRVRQPQAEPPQAKAGATAGHPAFRVDEARFSIHYHDIPLQLSRYEYRLLCVFLDKPGWVFSREKLMSLVWDEPEASMDRTVDAHIKSIRAKLRAVKPGIDPIKTKRGLGYALEEQS